MTEAEEKTGGSYQDIDSETHNENVGINLSPLAINAMDRLLVADGPEDINGDCTKEIDAAHTPDLALQGMEADGGEENNGDSVDWPNFDNAVFTPEQIAIHEDVQNIASKAIQEAERCADQIRKAIGNVGDGGTAELYFRRVLGDAFHFMDRVKVPVHHDWKAAYFGALRETIFHYDETDKVAVERVLQKYGRTWNQAVRHNFGTSQR
jgi:hypothetical protein